MKIDKYDDALQTYNILKEQLDSITQQIVEAQRLIDRIKELDAQLEHYSNQTTTQVYIADSYFSNFSLCFDLKDPEVREFMVNQITKLKEECLKELEGIEINFKQNKE